MSKVGYHIVGNVMHQTPCREFILWQISLKDISIVNKKGN